MHAKFEELYNSLILKIDEIAERILTLGHSPSHRFSDYLKSAELKESGKVSEGKQAITEILDSYKILIAKQRDLLKLSEEANDEGTNALMSDYIREQEKFTWMYSAYLT